MATSKQSQKRIRTNEKARVANKAIRGVMKSAVKGVTSAKDAADAKLQLAAADSTFYFKPQSALVQHQR